MKVILVADDERSLRLLLTATLASAPYEIVMAADGNEAWELALRLRPSLAILDVQMPGRTGLELARAMKSDERLNGTKIILLTSKAQQADIDAGLAAGADRYLTKPFSPVQLLRAVEDALAENE